MSYEYYSKWWAGTREVLEQLVARDATFVAATDKKVKKRNVASHLVGGIYSKYCMLVQDLGTILDQMAQPQKRIIVRKLMDMATVRLHELSEELRNIDISEYHYIDGALIELKLIPHDIEILDPILYYLRHYTVEELWSKIKKGERIYTPPPPPPPEGEEGQGEGGSVQEPPPEVLDSAKKHKKRPRKFAPEVKFLSEDELAEIKRRERITSLVTLIQSHERARQARLYFQEKWKQYEYRQKVRNGFKPPEVSSPEIQEQSALHIERLWRGHCARQLVKRKELERRFLINMYEPSWKSTAEFEKLEENLQKRQILRDARIKEYIESNLGEKARVFKVIGPRLMEDIGDEIREWFHQWYTEVKNFDKFPPEKKGGTVLVVRGETMTPKQWIDDVERKRKEKAKAGKDKGKLKLEKEKQKKLKAEQKKKQKEKLRKEKERKKKKKLKPWDFELEYEPSAAKDHFNAPMEEYHKIFDERKDEDNADERHHMDIIHEERCYEMQLELRKVVDDMMRLELDMLEEALMKDRAKRKGKKYKPKKKKKGKGKKKKKKKEPKDMTGHRSTEDLFQELVDNGIIHTYPSQYLKDFKGDFSYKNWEMRNRGFDPPATLGDVRQAVKINCVAPLSTETMRKPRSVLLVGPRQSGKHVLANAVFTESNSVVFDLSPGVMEGKYPGKKGMKMLLHLVHKMSRLLQPSIVYFDRAEKVFYKKVPKNEKHLDPKRIGKKLHKAIVKKIKPEDRVLVFGVSGAPWLGQERKMKTVFERIILMPPPDYGSVYLYWRELLMPYHGVDRNIDLSCLAKLTVSYPLPELKKAVEKVLTPRRIIQLSYNPLKQLELYEELINVNPITAKEYKKFLKFYNKIPLAKERKRLNQYHEKIRAQEAKIKEKQQQKAKVKAAKK